MSNQHQAILDLDGGSHNAHRAALLDINFQVLLRSHVDQHHLASVGRDLGHLMRVATNLHRFQIADCSRELATAAIDGLFDLLHLVFF